MKTTLHKPSSYRSEIKKLKEQIKSLNSLVENIPIYNLEYVESRIKSINTAIRSTNGSKPGETDAEYQLRLVRANRKKVQNDF
jgi:hypothetical protein